MAGVRMEIFRTGNGTITWSYAGAGTLGNLECKAWIFGTAVVSKVLTGFSYNQTGTAFFGAAADSGPVSFQATASEWRPAGNAPVTARTSGTMGVGSNSAAAQG
jgi:hypothetical protein